MSIITYGQGYVGNRAFDTPPGGGTFPAPGAQFVNSGFAFNPDDPKWQEPEHNTIVSPPGQGGSGSAWSDVLKAFSLAAGSALLERFVHSDSRSTGASAVPPTPTGTAAIVSPGFGEGYHPNYGGAPLPDGTIAQEGFTSSPLILAAAAGVLLLIFALRR